MGIEFKHPNYNAMITEWERNRDAISGQDAIKAKAELYLPKLGGQSPALYSAYLKRANFINFSGRTEQAGIGQILRKPPVVTGVETPANLYYTGKTVLSEIMTTNHGGILVDYNETSEQPEMIAFHAEEIINWRYSDQLTLIVLQGNILIEDKKDRYKLTKEAIYRELYIDEDGYYKHRTWRKSKDGYTPDEEIIPLMQGEKLTFIPFVFATTFGDDPGTRKPIISDIVNLNLSHYRNNADYENMLHWTGAKTIVTKGWGDQPFPVGGAPDFGIDGDAFFLEASSDSGLKDELRHKEENMAVLGSAMLSGSGRYVASAETARITSAGEYASLADISRAMSDLMTDVLRIYGGWLGKNVDEISIVYNTDFETDAMTGQDLIAWMGAVQAGMMSYDTFYHNLKRKDVYRDGWSLDDEKEAIKKAEDDRIEANGLTYELE